MNHDRYICNTASLISAVLIPAKIIFIQLGLPLAAEYPRMLSFYTESSQTFYDPDVNLVGLNVPMIVRVVKTISGDIIPITAVDENRTTVWVARGRDTIKPEDSYHLTVLFR